ncbi:DUF2637 domain-containing protein [Streptomyces sp. 8N706]|uniref:DUF2637 domain-containing protein n=1 Tax=Streptomyces sp. 8N706 TaxID=3457416 RepID=UPI003FD0BD55
MIAGKGNAPVTLSRVHRILITVVTAGAVLIAAIGFAGSYSAVRDLAEKKGFGAFSAVFPIGIDAGIVVLLALDLLLTWIRIPFPLLRQTAWLLTAATIAFNGAAAWPDPLGVGMHAVIPVLFVVAVEAARHAVGRIADITADRHMESVRITRWLLAFPSTFRLWRRMKLWELRSYEEVIRLEQDRLVYRARLRARYGRAWRRRAPVESLMPLRLARYGVPLSETGAAGLAAAGIKEPDMSTTLLPPDVKADLSTPTDSVVPEDLAGATGSSGRGEGERLITGQRFRVAVHGRLPSRFRYGNGNDQVSGPGRKRSLTGQSSGASSDVPDGIETPLADQRQSADDDYPAQQRHAAATAAGRVPASSVRASLSAASPDVAGEGESGQLTVVDRYYMAWLAYQQEHDEEPTGSQLSKYLAQQRITSRTGTPVSPSTLRRYALEFRIYRAWAQHCDRHADEPTAEELAQLLTQAGITGQYGAALTPGDLTGRLQDFRRRRSALSHSWTNSTA